MNKQQLCIWCICLYFRYIISVFLLFQRSRKTWSDPAHHSLFITAWPTRCRCSSVHVRCFTCLWYLNFTCLWYLNFTCLWLDISHDYATSTLMSPLLPCLYLNLPLLTLIYLAVIYLLPHAG